MMLETAETFAPRTTTDVVFDHLRKQILTLELLPGSRMSEADIASQMGVSRQPVRDAFNRLANLQLLKVRPQRATVVSGFSMSQIANARFVRVAVELEVVRSACQIWDDERAEALEANLNLQRAAKASGQIDKFHSLDYDFHKLFCSLSGHHLAFETIAACKQQVDRLCVLSLKKSDEASAVLADHEEMTEALSTQPVDVVVDLFRRHLGRLDETIKEIHEKHSEYFE